MTVLVHLHDDREAATAASPRSGASVPLSHAYSALRSELGACPIELGAIGALADNECEHERLPSDSTPPCGCWPSEVVKDPPRVVELPTEVAAPKPATPVPTLVVEEIAEEPAPVEEIADLEVTKPETPVLEPFVAGLVERIDRELERLHGERAAVLAVKEALHE